MNTLKKRFTIDEEVFYYIMMDNLKKQKFFQYYYPITLQKCYNKVTEYDM